MFKTFQNGDLAVAKGQPQTELSFPVFFTSVVLVFTHCVTLRLVTEQTVAHHKTLIRQGVIDFSQRIRANSNCPGPTTKAPTTNRTGTGNSQRE